MRRWSPPSEVGKSEQIGRRLFDEPMLAGTENQPHWNGIRMNHFEETRGRDISMDRLGATGVDRKVIAYLAPKATLAASKFHKAKHFDGWAHVAAKELGASTKGVAFPVVASPVTEPEDEVNDYHAHVSRSEEMEPHIAALLLREIFTKRGGVLKAEKYEVESRHGWVGRLQEGLALKRILLWVRKVFLR